MRIFSGIQPTGAKTLGNYAGGFRQYAQTQELGDAFFCIVDLHSITAEYEPTELHDSTLDLFAMLIATGLDPERSTIFAQSHIAARFNARYGETFRVPDGQYPEVGARVMDLQEPESKMSTSSPLTAQGVVRMLDEPDVIRKKLKSAVTDSGREVRHDREQKPGV